MENNLKKYKLWLKYLLLLCCGLMFSLTSKAQIVEPELTGNPNDWPNLFSLATAKVFVHDANSTDDNSFTTGSADVDPIDEWGWELGNTNDKGDITNAGAVLIGTRIYFFGDRTDVSGDAAIGFWLTLNGITPLADHTFDGDHADGDLLILSNFTKGGGQANLVLYKWNGLTNKIEYWKTTLDAKVNTQSFTVPESFTLKDQTWAYAPKGGGTGYPTGSFFEGFIDLALFGDVDFCYSGFLLETRNSQSIHASLQDFVAGNFYVQPNLSIVPTNVNCFGGNTGAADLKVEGGTEPFTYSWVASNQGAIPADQENNQDLTGLKAGTYTVTVTDALGCDNTASVNITQSLEQLTMGDCSKTDVVCFGQSTGSVTAGDITGAVGDLSYSWKNAAEEVVGNTASVSNLPAGTYTLTVTDDCSSVTCTVTIIQPEQLGLNLTPTNATCNVLNGPPNEDGKINIEITVALLDGLKVTLRKYDKSAGQYGPPIEKIPVPLISNFEITNLASGRYMVTLERLSDASCFISPEVDVNADECPTGFPGHLFPTQTACCNYLQDNAYDLAQLCYTTDGDKITNIIPGVFFYYIDFTTQATSSFKIRLNQHCLQPVTKLFDVQTFNQIALYNNSCKKISKATIGANGTEISANNVPAGTYVLAVKFDSKSIIGQAVTGTPMFTYYWDAEILFEGETNYKKIANSDASINLIANCTDNTPLPGICTKSADLTDIQVSQLPEAVEPTVSCMQVYPNPSSGIVNFEFSINESTKATLELFTAAGQQVATIFNENIEAGIVQKVIYTKTLTTGVYVYVLNWNDQKITGKLIITR